MSSWFLTFAPVQRQSPRYLVIPARNSGKPQVPEESHCLVPHLAWLDIASSNGCYHIIDQCLAITLHVADKITEQWPERVFMLDLAGSLTLHEPDKSASQVISTRLEMLI